MERINNVIKCAICHELLESPVFLPCSCNICKKHVQDQTNNVIRCEKCGVEHQIPTNGFHANNALQVLIEGEIDKLDFGSGYKSAKESCESVEKTLNEFKVLLNDPSFYTHERINELKNSVQQKGEELKLKIDEEMKKLIDKLEEYERQSNEYLSTNEFKEESKKLDDELNTTQSNLDSWLESLHKIKIDEDKWKSIKEESDHKLKRLTEESDKLKKKLLLNKFNENRNHVNWFKSIKIDPIFEYIPFYRDFLESRIINKNLAVQLEELLKKKELNDLQLSLLYQGSRDGFKAYDFHSHCDNRSNTLTIVKSTSGNIFGGFTSAQWKSIQQSYQFDDRAFIYSLVNKENRQLLFDHSSTDKNSIYPVSNFGPYFGGGSDLVIYDNSNTNTNSFSNLGKTYTHPEYPYGSEKARTILAGSYNFQVQEIEVFHIQ